MKPLKAFGLAAYILLLVLNIWAIGAELFPPFRVWFINLLETEAGRQSFVAVVGCTMGGVAGLVSQYDHRRRMAEALALEEIRRRNLMPAPACQWPPVPPEIAAEIVAEIAPERSTYANHQEWEAHKLRQGIRRDNERLMAAQKNQAAGLWASEIAAGIRAKIERLEELERQDSRR